MTGSVNVASNTSLQPLPMEYYYGRAFVVVGLGIIAGLAELFGETYSGAGIGGGVDGGYSSITINNSIVTAKSAGYAAAIGSGDEAETNGPIRITDSSIYRRRRDRRSRRYFRFCYQSLRRYRRRGYRKRRKR